MMIDMYNDRYLLFFSNKRRKTSVSLLENLTKKFYPRRNYDKKIKQFQVKYS
jgi:hypothetical protein